MLAFNDPTEYSKTSLSIPILGMFKKQKGECRVEIMIHPRSGSFEWGSLANIYGTQKDYYSSFDGFNDDNASYVNGVGNRAMRH